MSASRGGRALKGSWFFLVAAGILFLASFGNAFSYPIDVFETYPNGQSSISRANEVVTFGFPFPKGDVSSVNSLKVKNATSMQFTELGKWPDGSLKWALVDFVLPSLGSNAIDSSYAIENGGSGNAGGSDVCSQAGTVVTADTGSPNGAVFKIKGTNYDVLDQVTLYAGNDTIVSPPNQGGIIFWDESGNELNSNAGNASRLEILQNGPVRCQVVAEGLLGSSGVGYRVIYDFFKGSAKVNMTVSFKNSLYASPTHKPVRGGIIRIDTAMQGNGITAEAAGSGGSPQSFTLDAGNKGVVSNWYSSLHSTEEEGNLGFATGTYQGYAVDTYPTAGGSSTAIVPRTSASGVPTYVWLKLSQGSRNVSVTGRYAPYYYPNGATGDADTGYLSWDLLSPTYPQQPMNALRYKMYYSQEVQFNFSATNDSLSEAKRFTNKVIFIPNDKTYFGSAGAFYLGAFQSLTNGELQSFYNRPDVSISKSVCTNLQDNGPSAQEGVSLNPPFSVFRAGSPNLTGGGLQNNASANETYSTFITGARGKYPLIEQVARYRGDWEEYLDDKTFTDPKNSASQTEFQKKATNTNEMKTLFGSPWAAEVLDAAHNWSWKTNLDFYHYTGREEFRKGLNATFYRLRMTTWVGSIHYTRPLGMQLQGYAHLLNYFKETNDSRFAEHNQFVHDHLNGSGYDSVLYAEAPPKWGYYQWDGPPAYCTLDNPSTPQIENNYCLGAYLDNGNNGGWIAPPGQAIDSSTLPPEYAANGIVMQALNGFHSPEGSDNGTAGCQDGERAFMLANRLGLGLIELYASLQTINPSDSVLDPLGKRIGDIAKQMGGSFVGKGAYHADFSNPAGAYDNYVYCSIKSSETVAGITQNYYVYSYIASFAAKIAPTTEEKKYWQNFSVNNVKALHADGFLNCAREFDVKVQDSIKGFLASGELYTPSSYPQGSPTPGNNVSFSLSSVVPTTVMKGVSTLITLNGNLFTNTDQVDVGNGALPLITPTFVNASKLTFTLSASQSNTLGLGTFAVRVKQGSTYSNSQNLTVGAATPILNSITPSGVVIGNGQLFTLDGAVFLSGAQVKVGSLALKNTTFNSSSQLTFNLSATEIATLGVGVHNVYVQNPGGEQSGMVTLTILATGSPVLSAFTPIDIEINTGGTITLNGSGFQSGAKSYLQDVIVPTKIQSFPTTFVNSGQVTFSLSSAQTTTLGPSIYQLFVQNPDKKTSNAISGFVIYTPYLTAVSPANVVLGSNASFTIDGLYFKSGAVIGIVGGMEYAPTTTTQTQLTLELSSDHIQTLGVGTHSLYVKNPAGGQSNALTFTATNPDSSGDTTPPGPGDTGTGGSDDGGGGGGGGSGGGGDGSTVDGSEGETLTCVQSFELCNGMDDDCDSQIDEGCETAPSALCTNGVQDEKESGIDCGGICSNWCLLPIPESASLLFLAALNPIMLFIQYLLRILGLA
jgi:hypothetical protein